MKPRRAGIAVRGVDSPDELRAANDLMAKTQLPKYWDSLAWLESMGAGSPGYRLEHTRVAYLGGALAGALRLITAQIRIGRARWKIGGLGWVSTAPAFRGKGVCTALIEDANAYMAAHGYHASLLFGIPDLYHRFGYAVALADHTIVLEASTVAIGDLPAARTRRLDSDDISALRRMHDAHEDKASCSLVRAAADWANQFRHAPPVTPFGPDWRNAVGLMDARGRLRAYFMMQPGKDRLHLKEIGLAAQADAPALLRACIEHARRKEFGKLVFHAPPQHPMARFLEDYDSQHITEHFREREGMLRLLDIGAALDAMRPEWEAQLGQCLFPVNAGAFTLSVGRAHWRLEFARGGIVIRSGKKAEPALRLAPSELARLLVGFGHTQELLSGRIQHWDPASKALCQALFRKRYPFVWPIDHF